MADEALLSTTELAQKLKRHPSTISRWARRGWIPSKRVNKRVIYFSLNAVTAAMDNHNLK